MPPKYSQQLRNTIEKLRTRLLDLTGRNPSISFRHNAKSRKQIRIIDEVPDQLFTRLISLKSLEFRGIPVPDLEPSDEKTPEFKTLLYRQMKTDEIYLKGLNEAGETPTKRQLRKLELELRDRMRERLDFPKVDRETRPPVTVAGEKLGLNVNFELPTRQISGKHTDEIIQTLKYDDDLQLDLSSLYQFAELSDAETGTSPLYLALGFLEWYESDNSEKAMYSPLILIPVEIKFRKLEDRVAYYINAREPEPITNISLFERLNHDFGIRLPSLVDPNNEDSYLYPSVYFSQLTSIISKFPEWKIHNWATISAFSFSKMAMYKELERGNLDEISSEATPLESLLLNQERVDENHSFATDYDVEDPKLKKKVPRIISSADVSQLSAIIDALENRNLVIEGPPGTGKSQTITNMIAALVEQGKTVLFVAEKRAALSVVKERLNGAKLGPFCLELHSSKAKRKEVIDSLDRRLKIQKERTPEQLVLDLERQIGDIKEELGQYIGSINHYHAPLNMTLHEILWKLLMLQESAIDLPPNLKEIRISKANDRTKFEIDKIGTKLKQLSNEFTEQILPFGKAKDHPWAGLIPKGLAAPKITLHISSMSTVLQHLKEIQFTVEKISPNLSSKSIVEIEKCLAKVDNLQQYAHSD